MGRGSSRRKHAMCGALLACGLGGQPVARAAEPEEPARLEEPVGLEVVWREPAACSGLEELEREARRLLGGAVATAGVRVDAALVQLPDGRYRIDLLLEGRASGARSLEAERCEEALRAGAVVLALAVNPEVIEHSTERVEESPPTSRAAPEREAAPRRDEAPPAGERRAGFWERAAPFVGLHARLGAGLTPGPRAGVGVMLGVDFDWLRLEARGAGDPAASEESRVDGPTIFWALGGGLRVCARGVEASSLALRLCAGASWFEVSALAEGLEESELRKAGVASGEFQLSFAWRFFDELSLVLDAGYVVPMTQPRFVVESGGAPVRVVHQVEPGPLGTLGVEIAF